MHWGWKCTATTELPNARLGDVLKGVLPSLGGGVNAVFCIVSYWQGVKIRKGWLKLCDFQCIGGGYVLATMNYRTLGWAMHQKVHRLALAEV